MQNKIELSIVMWTYLDRPIHYINFNGYALGVAGAYGGTGVITGISIPFGEQKLTWELGGPEEMARNCEQGHNKNKIVLNASDIPPGTRFLGLHLYPVDTVEMIFTDTYPGVSERGAKLRGQRK